MNPTNHHLTVTVTDVKQMRGTVVAVTKLGPGAANLVIETHDVLPVGEYDAVYTTPTQEARGLFKVFWMGVSSNYKWRASGIFTRAKERRIKL